jgi:FAD/FMN-containing dehydrogenase
MDRLDRLLASLRDAVGPGHVLTDPSLRATYETDWTRRWSGAAAAVVRPAATGEVAAVVRLCAEHDVAVVPQGGNTGLVGGSVPRATDRRRPPVVVSTSRLNGLAPVDEPGRSVIAGAGVTVEALQKHAAAAGLRYGVDLAARGSATIGGTVATNAGGLHVVSDGRTADQLLGIEAVLADGSVVRHLQGPVIDTSGYDLARLLCGSEGTLGVVTAARLRLLPLHRGARLVALIGMAEPSDGLALLNTPGLAALELVCSEAFELVCRVTGLPGPLPGPHRAYVLVEAYGVEASDLAELLPATAEVAVDERLWTYRERVTESIASLGLVHKLDVALPLNRLADFFDALPAATVAARTYVFGHLGVGNLHVNVAGVAPDDETVDDAVYALVASLGGSVTAEHGVGVAKAAWLARTRSPEELKAMRRIKDALDPRGLLNPGVLFSSD